MVDIGNSSIKIGLFKRATLLKDFVFEQDEDALRFINDQGQVRIIISSVKKEVLEFSKKIKHRNPIILEAQTPIPFLNHYNTKDTLGLDRIAAVAGAQALMNNSNKLIIDIGTCITYDFIDRSNQYKGGGISPGVVLRFKAMNSYTSKLPSVETFEASPLIGNSTKEALVSGVINGITAELEGIIDQYRTLFPDLKVFVCGGGLNCFESKLKTTIFAAPKLVLIGLNRILEYNEES